ncbi:MAG: ribosome small subunit-dependent GTPase A [Lutibacter sp.]
MKGVVTKSTGSWYTIFANGKSFDCRLKGKFRIKGIKSTNPVAVGDKVCFELEPDKETGLIESIEKRKNYLIRKSVNLSKQTHIIAANIDIAFLMITLKKPVTFAGFIDRFLASAEAYRIKTVLLFNKLDLYDEAEKVKLEELIAIYEKIGYQCLKIEALSQKNINEVKSLMKGKTTIFSGHSGVGKSTLINAIAPHLALKTAPISKQHQQGMHTTTFAEMYPLSFGGFIIDTPGIKGFGVVDFNPQEIAHYFPEFFEASEHCKYNNCLHINEPHCAVKQQLESGEIATSRYKSYIQLMEGDSETYRVDNYS